MAKSGVDVTVEKQKGPPKERDSNHSIWRQNPGTHAVQTRISAAKVPSCRPMSSPEAKLSQQVASAEAQAAQKKEEGNAAFAAKDYESAARLYTAAISLDPTSHVYFSNRAAVYQAQGLFEKAEADARECLRRKPDFIKGYFRLALAQQELGLLDDAEKSLKAGLAIDAGNADLTRQLRLLRAKRAGKKKKRSAAPVRQKGGAPKIDEATAQELSELGEQYQSTQRELASVQQSQRLCAIDLKKVEITRRQLSELDESATVLKGIGKMFMRASRAEILQGLSDGKDKGEKLTSELKSKEKYLARRLESQERNLKEIMANAQSEDA
eukprot:scaffold5189_cov275-Pinguiococcus_pyrenoidosus.AAC.1